MKNVKITTPENIEVEYRLAAAGSRITAAFMDYLIQGCVYVLLFLVFIDTRNPVHYFEARGSYFLAIVILIMALINYGYFTLSEMIMEGRTLGKKLLGLKTIRKNGQPIGISHSLIRNLFRIFVDNYFVGILMMFLREDYGRLGDILSSTMVIEEEKQEILSNFIRLPKDIEKKLTEEEIELLITYLKEKDEITIGKEELHEEVISYFDGKYASIDEEILVWVKEQVLLT